MWVCVKVWQGCLEEVGEETSALGECSVRVPVSLENDSIMTPTTP